MNKTNLKLIISAILTVIAVGCETKQRNPEYAGTYVLDKDYYVVTLKLHEDGVFTYEKQWTEEEHPLVRDFYRGRLEEEKGEWISRPDRTDRERSVILLLPSPPQITRLVITEDGNLDEFTSSDVYRKNRP